MPRDVRIGTPENVPIHYELAGLGSRAVAAITDITIQSLFLGVLGLMMYLFMRYTGMGIFDLPSRWLTAASGIVVFIVIWGYYFSFEAWADGQTPGKRAEGLRVVRDGGLPVDVTASAIRNLVRFVDFLPGFYILGAWAIFISPYCKRLGDYAAGTLVVKERVGEAPMADAVRVEPNAPEAWAIRNAARVTPEEYQMIKRFADRRAELAPAVREELARRISEPLIEKLEIDISSIPEFRHSVFLIELQRRCQEERGYL